MVETINIKTMLYNKNEQKMKPQTYLMLVLWLAVAVSIITPFVNAQESLGVFKQNDQVQLVQTCSICDYVTLDSIKYPDGTINSIDENMTKVGSTFYYNFTQTSQLGEYIYNTYYGNWTAPVSFEIEGGNLNLFLVLVGGSLILLLFAFLFKSPWISFASGSLMIVSGIYLMGYGLQFFSDLYTRSIAYTLIGIGLFFAVVSGFDVFSDEW